MYGNKQTKLRCWAETIGGETEISVELVMSGMSDNQESRVRESSIVFWDEVERIAEEQEAKTCSPADGQNNQPGNGG